MIYISHGCSLKIYKLQENRTNQANSIPFLLIFYLMEVIKLKLELPTKKKKKKESRVCKVMKSSVKFLKRKIQIGVRVNNIQVIVEALSKVRPPRENRQWRKKNINIYVKDKYSETILKQNRNQNQNIDRII